MKKIIALLTIALCLIIGACFYFTDQLKNRSINGIKEIIKTEISIGGSSFDFLSSTVMLNDVKIANPSGFTGKVFMEAKSISIELENFFTVLKEPIAIKQITVTQPKFHYETNASLKSNLGTIGDNVEEYAIGNSSQVMIGKFVFNEADVVASINLVLGKMDRQFKLEQITINNIGVANGGLKAEQVAINILDEVLEKLDDAVKKNATIDLIKEGVTAVKDKVNESMQQHQPNHQQQTPEPQPAPAPANPEPNSYQQQQEKKQTDMMDNIHNTMKGVR